MYDPEKDEIPSGERAVRDADEMKQRRLLQNILDALDDVEEAQRVALDGLAQGEMTADGKNILLQRAVSRSIREAYNLLRSHAPESDNGDDAGDDRDQYWLGDPDDPIGQLPYKTREDAPVVGLRDYLHLPETYSEHSETTNNPRHGAPETVTEEHVHTVPAELSEAAYLRLRVFLGDIHEIKVAFEAVEDNLPAFGFDDPPEDEDIEVV